MTCDRLDDLKRKESMQCRNVTTVAGHRKSSDEQDDIENDLISLSIGQYGRWQLRMTFLLALFNIPCTWHIFAPTFLAVERETWCARSPDFEYVEPAIWKNYTQPIDFCSMIELRERPNMTFEDLVGAAHASKIRLLECTKWEFAGAERTLISEFSLLCDRKTLNNISEMMFLAGVAFGGIICGIISDKFGRRRTLLVSLLIQTLVGISIAFIPSFNLYLILRAMLGFISVSVVFSGFVLAIELVGGKWRTVVGISYLFPVSLGYMTISILGWTLRDWRQLQLAISLPGFIFLILAYILPESPRWLHTMGKNEQVMKILQMAAIVNDRELPMNLDKLLIASCPAENSCGGVMDLFRTPKMRKRTLLLFVIWFSVYLMYYGLVLNLGNIGGDLYMNSALSGAVEVPAVMLAILIMLKMGRRWPSALTFLFSGVACGLTIPVHLFYKGEHQWLITTLAMTSRLSSSATNAVIPVFTAELYPTTIRNIGVGASNVSAGIALMLVPCLWELAAIHSIIPMCVLMVFGVIGGVCATFLPETGKGRLMDTIEEADESKDTSEKTKHCYSNNNFVPDNFQYYKTEVCHL